LARPCVQTRFFIAKERALGYTDNHYEKVV
jgi:hypothetical protein